MGALVLTFEGFLERLVPLQKMPADCRADRPGAAAALKANPRVRDRDGALTLQISARQVRVWPDYM